MLNHNLRSGEVGKQQGYAADASIPPQYSGAQMVEKDRSGAVERELGRLNEAIVSLENHLTEHVTRLQPVVLMVPNGSGGAAQASAPDAPVCDVAQAIRAARRRVEELTAQMAFVTSKIDL